MLGQEPFSAILGNGAERLVAARSFLVVDSLDRFDELVGTNDLGLDVAFGVPIVEDGFGVGEHDQATISIVGGATGDKIRHGAPAGFAQGLDELKVPVVLGDGRVDTLLLSAFEGADEVSSAVDLDIADEVLALDDEIALWRYDEEVDLSGEAFVLQEKILQDEHIHVGILEFVQDVPFTVDAGRARGAVFLQSRLGPRTERFLWRLPFGVAALRLRFLL